MAAKVIGEGPVIERKPFKAGCIAGDLQRFDELRLTGSRCEGCGVSLLAIRHRCENCSSKRLAETEFSRDGSVYSYTVQRYEPPKPHGLTGEWKARPLAWVDLDLNGPRILGPVDAEPELMRIGMPVRVVFYVGWVEDDTEMIAYRFVPAPEAQEPAQ